MTTATYGTLLLVALTLTTGALAMVAIPTTETTADEIRADWYPTRPNGTADFHGYTIRITEIHGARQAHTTIATNGTHYTATLETGDHVYVPCPTPHDGVRLIVDDEVSTWSAMPACHTDDTTTTQSPPNTATATNPPMMELEPCTQNTLHRILTCLLDSTTSP